VDDAARVVRVQRRDEATGLVDPDRRRDRHRLAVDEHVQMLVGVQRGALGAEGGKAERVDRSRRPSCPGPHGGEPVCMPGSVDGSATVSGGR
jgi:hypothetical protein